jgi:hypothetical protein
MMKTQRWAGGKSMRRKMRRIVAGLICGSRGAKSAHSSRTLRSNASRASCFGVHSRFTCAGVAFFKLLIRPALLACTSQS